MGDVAAAWFALVPRKGLETLGQMESGILRVQTLRRIAQGNGSLAQGRDKGACWIRLRDEAARIEGTKEKIHLLKEVASDMAPIDKERAQATYLKAYQIAEKEFLTKPRVLTGYWETRLGGSLRAKRSNLIQNLLVPGCSLLVLVTRYSF